MACFDDSFILTLIVLLDSMYKQGGPKFLSDTKYYNEELIFKKSLEKLNTRAKTGLNYEESLQFYAYCSFITKFQGRIEPLQFYQWMRVICNLTVNTPCNNLDEFKDLLLSVSTLVTHADNILEFIANSESYKSIKGFYAQQVREEHIKAILMIKSDAWKSRILQAEQHGYFSGQIEFLLSFSGVLEYYLKNNQFVWSTEEELNFLTRFSLYLEKSFAAFNGDGLKTFSDFLWERALLATGNYLLYARRNLNFLDNVDRDTSWKRLLRGEGKVTEQSINAKREFVRLVLDKFDISSPENSLFDIIRTAVIDEDWRKMIVEKPEMIDQCKRRAMRESNGNYYLLSKTQMNSLHHNLHTYHFMLSAVNPRIDSNNLAPFLIAKLEQVATEMDEPCIRFYGCKIANAEIFLDIDHQGAQFAFKVSMSSGAEMPDLLRNKLQALGFNDNIAMVPNNAAESQLDNVIKALENMDSLEGRGFWKDDVSNI